MLCHHAGPWSDMCLCLGHEFPIPLLQLTSPVIPQEKILSFLGAFQNPEEMP